MRPPHPAPAGEKQLLPLRASPGDRFGGARGVPLAVDPGSSLTGFDFAVEAAFGSCRFRRSVEDHDLPASLASLLTTVRGLCAGRAANCH